MISIEHAAYHLYRENAYAEYCWSVDAYGMSQPASFIYLCFEGFRDHCAKHGLHLQSQQELTISGNGFPSKGDRCKFRNPLEHFGLIVRLETAAQLELVQKYVGAGKNAIALLPTELIGCHWKFDEKRREEALAAAAQLGVAEAHTKMVPTLANRDTVWWEELPAGPGRLFVTRDCFLSDGYYREGYGLSLQNTASLDRLIAEFATFRTPLLRFAVESPPSVWPCHETMSFPLELVNHGPQLSDADISIDFLPGFEPLGPVEREISRLATHERMTFLIQAVPRVHGRFQDFLRVSAHCSDGSRPRIAWNPLDLTVTASYGPSLRNQARKDDPGLCALVRVLKPSSSFAEVSVLPALVHVDPSACLNKIRVLAEKLVKLIVAKQRLRPRQSTFAGGIEALQHAQILSQRAVGYLNTVRVIGNLASHPSGEELTDVDVRIAAFALASAAEESLNKSLL